MGLIPLGILSSAGGSLGAYELIETQILGSSTTSVVFSGLAAYDSVYKHLQIRIIARSDRGSVGDAAVVRFNGDTGANYSRHGLFGNGSAAGSYGLANQTYGDGPAIPGSSGSTNAFGAGVIDVLDAYALKNRTTRTLGGSTGAENFVALASGSWRNTSSLTSMTVAVQSGSNFIANSRFSLYGIR